MTPIIVPHSEDSSSSQVLVESSRALHVAQAAAEAFRARIQSLRASMVEGERARRRRFNASWLGRLLPFLQEDPDADITPGPHPDDQVVDWTDEEFHLKMFEHFLAQAESVAGRARATESALVLSRSEWNRLLSWSASAQNSNSQPPS